MWGFKMTPPSPPSRKCPKEAAQATSLAELRALLPGVERQTECHLLHRQKAIDAQVTPADGTGA